MNDRRRRTPAPTATDAGAAPATIVVVGLGAAPDAWARGLRSVEHVEVVRVAGVGADGLVQALASERVTAVAFAGAAQEVPGAIKNALMAQRHVFVATPLALTERQFKSLAELAARRGRMLMFDTPSFGDERLNFVRKMIAGVHALWRPRYIRILRTGATTASLDELAIGEIAAVLSLVDAAPANVTALVPRDDEESAAGVAVSLGIAFEDGAVARIDVSTLEPAPIHEITVACDGRTITVDALDSRRPLQIQSAGGHRGPQRSGQWAETVSEHPLAETPDRTSAAAAAFVAAIRGSANDAGQSAGLARASFVWECARASITSGDSVRLSSAETPVPRPALQLIRGGGRSSERSAAALTLVECDEASPPRTA